MSTKSDTPRTNALMRDQYGNPIDAIFYRDYMIDLARTLERELSELRAERDALLDPGQEICLLTHKEAVALFGAWQKRDIAQANMIRDLRTALEAVKQIADESLMGLTNQRIQDLIRPVLAAGEKP